MAIFNLREGCFILFIPQIYDDELLYSVIARYHSLSGNLNYKHSIQDCFNFDTVVPSIGFPSLLENLSKNTQNPTVLSSDYFINKCTMLPIYTPF